MTTQLSITDYTSIANMILSTDREVIEVEFEKSNTMLFLELVHVTQWHEEIGGSYEGYDFEAIGVCDRDEYHITDFACINIDTDQNTETDFNEGILLNLLNN